MNSYLASRGKANISYRPLCVSSSVFQCDKEIATDYKPKSVIIFSIARGTSTLLFRVLSQLIGRNSVFSEGNSLLEPFTQAYHIENNLEDTPGFNRQSNWPSSTEEAKELVLTKVKENFTIIKDLAFQLDENRVGDDFLTELFQYAEPLFLVRSPESTIPSGIHPYYQSGDVSQYSSKEAGFQELNQLFNRSTNILGRSPLVIEAEEYLSAPEEKLSQYFNELGLEFKAEYLNLTPYGEQEEKDDPSFQVWGDTWYKNAFDTNKLEAKKIEKCTQKKYQELFDDECSLKRMHLRLIESIVPYKRILQAGRKPK